MNKFLLVLGVVVLAVIGWILLTGDNVNYVAEIDEEVTALETEFAQIEVALEAGTLTPAEAADAQARIAARLDAINSSVTNGVDRVLTETERRQLAAALERLKQALIRYSDTLASVDEAVLELPEAERPQLDRRRGGSNTNRTITAFITQVIDALEEHVEDVVEDYVPNDTEELGTSTDEISEDTSTSSSVSTDEETAAESDAVPADESTDTPSEDDTDEPENTTESDDTADTETDTPDDAETEVEADPDFNFSESASASDTDDTEESSN